MFAKFLFFVLILVCFAQETVIPETSVLPETIKVVPQIKPTGILDPEDIKKRAAEGNDAEAIFMLGMFHEFGRHAEYDPKKSFECYLKAADMGHRKAQHNVAYMYKFGQDGVEKSISKAVKYWQMAADQGFSISQRYLGLIYLKGYENVPAEVSQGLELLQKAADQNDLIAQYRIGKIYALAKYGQENKKDLGVTYLKKSADQNYFRAKNLLESISPK